MEIRKDIVHLNEQLSSVQKNKNKKIHALACYCAQVTHSAKCFLLEDLGEKYCFCEILDTNSVRLELSI